MRIAIPYAPCDRRIGFRQFLKYHEAVHWCQIKAAINCRQENAKEPRACEFAREIFRQPPGCFDRIALRDERAWKSRAVARSAAPYSVSCIITPNTATKLDNSRYKAGHPGSLQLLVTWPYHSKLAHRRISGNSPFDVFTIGATRGSAFVPACC